jgi:hypothetical protein
MLLMRGVLMNQRMLIGAVVLSSAVLLLFAYHCYPLPAPDAFAFLPATISFAAGKGLVNPLCSFTPFLVDDAGQLRYVQYPPLYNLLVGFLMWKPTPQSALLVISILNLGNVALTGLLLSHASRSYPEDSIYRAVVCVGGLIGLSSLFVIFQNGRPEGLATLWLLLGAWTLRRTSRFSWPLVGGLFGLLVSTHIASAAISIAVIGGYLSWTQPTKSQVALMAIKTGATACLVFLTVLWLSPNSTHDTLVGIGYHARVAGGVVGWSWGHLASVWMTNPLTPAHGLLVVATAISGFIAVYLCRHQIRVRLFLWLSVFVGLVCSGYLAFRAPQFGYNLYPFIPLGILMLVHVHGITVARGRRFSAIVSTLGVLTLMSICSVGGVRHLVLFPRYYQEGMSLDEARSTFDRVVGVTQDDVGVSTALWMLTEDYGRLHVLHASDIGRSLDTSARFLIWQQVQLGRLEPPRMPGFRLILNHYRPGPVRLAGIKLATAVPGYQFAALIAEEHD